MREYSNCSELRIHLDDVSCSGTESMLTECSQSGVSISHSSHDEVAAVICSGEECLHHKYLHAEMCTELSSCRPHL